MALAQVLTAVRELILDERQYPQDENGRLRYLEDRYPELTGAEREDLAKITPDRLKLYTVSIFAGERNVLRAKFPIVFELLDRFHRERGGSFDSFEFIREIHGACPWRSAQVSDLVGNFCRYLREHRSDLLEGVPGLSDVLMLEELTFAVPRAREDAGAPKHPVDLAERENEPLEQILELTGYVPGYVRAAEFSYRCPELYRYRRQNDELPAGAVPEPGKSFGIVSRTPDYSTRWSTVSEEMFAALSKQPKGEPFPISALAEEFLAASPPGRGEAESARQFLSDLVLLNCNGAVLISA